MRRVTIGFRPLLPALAGLISIGCSSNDDSLIRAENPSEAPLVTAIQPLDGSVDVPTTAWVGIRFDRPMDTASVEACFYLSGGESMHAWMDSIDHHRGGMMGRHMVDMKHMMAWMDTLCLQGEMHWNEVMDSCYFDPHGGLLPATDYMLYLYGEVRSRHGVAMDASEFEYGGPMYHFRTRP